MIPKEFIPKLAWNVLIVLDSCRYDYFSKYNVIEGSIEVYDSNYTHTIHWLEDQFPNYYNILYLSANPHINSKVAISPHHYRAKDHFYKIIDLWDIEWKEELGTVPPERVTNRSLSYLDLHDRIIVHYMQPHPPFIGKTKLLRGYWNRDLSKLEQDKIYINPPDRELIQLAYSSNLELVLSEVRRLIDNIPRNKRVYICNDHGEMLGEDNLYSHLPYTKHPYVTTIFLYNVRR